MIHHSKRPEQAAQTNAQWKADLKRRWAIAKEWTRIHVRRWAHVFHGASEVTRVIGPASFLVVSAAVGVALTITTLYSTSYAVTLNGETVGVVADQEIVTAARSVVEAEGSQLLGYDFQVEGELDYQFGLTLKSDLDDQKDIQDFFYDKLDEVSDELRQYELSLDGRRIGTVKDEESLNEMLDGLKSRYINDNTTGVEFVENLAINFVYNQEDLMTVAEMEEQLTASSVGETTYTVQSGDTFNKIAYANDMSVSDLQKLNPDVNINRLQIGQVLNVKEMIPVLSVRTTEHQIYNQEIACPIIKEEDPTMYKGDSKVLIQGTPGEALVEADVVYVNGYERERTILSSTTLREPTTTTMAVGTKEKPKTASKGYYIWPASGRITSYFGGRYIFGSYSYHGGIDIKVSYGQAIKASDGGTVTFAGWKGTYGKLVIIKHDNGTQTYYGHNSSLLVSAGDKVYQGQTIAKGGSTGRSTGNHCHFEVRINGKAVNPLNYLR